MYIQRYFGDIGDKVQAGITEWRGSASLSTPGVPFVNSLSATDPGGSLNKIVGDGGNTFFFGQHLTLKFVFVQSSYFYTHSSHIEKKQMLQTW